MILILSAGFLAGCNFQSGSKTSRQSASELQAQDNLNKGIKAFSQGFYSDASKFFEKAVQLDPSSETARMDLATVYLAQWVPGLSDPANAKIPQKAMEAFKQIVEKLANPTRPNEDAMLAIASIYFQLQKLDESRDWYKILLKTNPQNSEAHYCIGVIAFDDSIHKTGVQGEKVALMNPGEKTQIEAGVDEGLASLKKALEIRSVFYEAMEYQSLLLREKAKLAKDAKTKLDFIRRADQLWKSALDLLRTQGEVVKKIRQTDSDPLHLILRQLTSPPFPPPQPPPLPPHPVGRPAR